MAESGNSPNAMPSLGKTVRFGPGSAVGTLDVSTKGPTVTVEVQLLTLSTVQMWNHHDPSASSPLVTPVAPSSRSLLSSQTGESELVNA